MRILSAVEISRKLRNLLTSGLHDGSVGALRDHAEVASRSGSAFDEDMEEHYRARDRFRVATSGYLHRLLKDALYAIQTGTRAPDQELTVLDELRETLVDTSLKSAEQYSHLEYRVKMDCAELGDFIDRQGNIMRVREQELSDVVALLTRSVADASRDNQSFYSEVRAEGERIEQASQTDDLIKLKSVLQVVTSRLHGLIEEKETQDQSRIDALSDQVEALKDELQVARQKAETDGLTSVMNRRAFDDAINGLVRRYRGTRRSFALIFLDIDDFKTINDRFGHLVGDRALVAVSQHCQSMLRPDDLLARYGGEEFAMILDGASVRSGLKRAESICKEIASQRYRIDNDGEERVLRMTVSAGVVAFRRNDTVQELIKRADGELYAAKAAGKNQAMAAK